MDTNRELDAKSPLWNVDDVAALLRTTAGAVYKLVERREIPHLRLGRRVLFDPNRIREWIGRFNVAENNSNRAEIN